MATKIKYNVKGVEAGGDLVPVKPGLYKAKIVECSERTSRNGNEMLEVVFEIIEKGEFKGRKLWYYVITDDEAMAFRFREFLEATGIVDPKKPKTETGTFEAEGTVGTEVQVRVRSGRDHDDNPRGEVAKMLKLSADAEDDDDDGEDEADWDEMDLDELRSEVEDYEGDAAEIIKEAKAGKSKAKKEAALRAWLEENATEDEDGDEDDDDDEDGEDEQDYSEMSLSELKETAEERGVEVEGKATKAKLVAALEEDDEEEGDDEDDEDGDEEGEDYSSWEIQDLKDELKKRKLPTKGKKSVLAARLEKDDEEGDGDPF